MELSNLTAMTPLDGRYASQTKALRAIFSEFGLIKYRYLIELRWIQHLAAQPQIEEVPALNENTNQKIEQWISSFGLPQAQRVKEIEASINHDVKAVEYLIKEQFATDAQLKQITEFVHFGCTSEDINNLAYALMLKDALTQHFLPQAKKLLVTLKQQAQRFIDAPVLARTHGQVASPTTFGKEWVNVCARLQRALSPIECHEILGKFNGAVGNFSAHNVAYPEVNWPEFCAQFIQTFGLKPNNYTTQIEPHDTLAELFDALARWNRILIDFCRDTWGYIALELLKQQPKADEVGSSTMPHKINPIDFENAEGNLGLANALLNHFSSKLVISRWQRDLSDSTVMRNIGSALGYLQIALHALHKGLGKITVDKHRAQTDLANNWQVLAEPLQTVMRRYGIDQPYEKLKQLTRGQSVTQEDLHAFIDSLSLPQSVKARLLALTPENYVGLAQELVEQYLQEA